MANEKRGIPFEPGKSGNPKGRPPLPDDVKEARKLTKIEFERIANKYIHMTRAELKVAAKEPEATAMDRMVIKIIVDAVKFGKIYNIEFLLDRLVGKVIEKRELTGKDGGPLEFSSLTDEQLDAKLLELQAKAEKASG